MDPTFNHYIGNDGLCQWYKGVLMGWLEKGDTVLYTEFCGDRGVGWFLRVALRSGRSEASRPPSPLRTVLESFPSHGSSISKVTLFESPGCSHHPMSRQFWHSCHAFACKSSCQIQVNTDSHELEPWHIFLYQFLTVLSPDIYGVYLYLWIW